MKTIEDAANEYADKNQKSRLSNSVTKKDFKAGVEFAQQWYSVEDELPPVNERILLKNDSCEYVGFFSYGNFFASTFFILGRNEKIKKPTHWRPINLV